MKQLKIIFTLCILVFSINLLAGSRVVKQTYETINPAYPTQSGDKIEVMEIFWYGCPHCYKLEPYLEKWLENKPEDVSFVRVPGVLGKNWIPHAKAFYAANQMNIFEQFHRPFFDAIHKEGEHLVNERRIGDFIEQKGMDRDKFSEAFNSEEVDKQLKQAFKIGRDLRITGVPTIIVNGKYITSATLTGSNEKLIKVINSLIKRERASGT